MAESEVLHGKEMSYNNFLDVEAAVNLVKEFDETACVIVKHNNPCGVAISHTPEKAYREALSRDPKSAFGGIVAFNRSVDIDTAKALTEIFLEVIVAPDFDKDAFDYLTEKKKNLRLVKIKNFDKKLKVLITEGYQVEYLFRTGIHSFIMS